MNEAVTQVGELLRELAAHLGTTVEALWPYMVTSVRFQWCGITCAALVSIILGVYCLKWGMEYAKMEYAKKLEEDYGAMWGSVVTLTLAIVLLVGALICSYRSLSTFDHVIVPEAEAAQRLIEKVNGGGRCK